MYIDIKNNENTQGIKELKKLTGIRLITEFLPSIDCTKQIYVIEDLEDWEKIKDQFTDIVTCRTDNKIGEMIPPMYGVTIPKEQVPTYINQVKKKEKQVNEQGEKYKPYILCIEMEKGTNERIHTKGGIVLDIIWGQSIKIGYVGPSFDSNEITKGKAEHESWVIPWEKIRYIQENTKEAYNQYRKDYMMGSVKQEAYLETAKQRASFLIDQYPEQEAEIIKTMPKEYVPMSQELFQTLRNKVINQLTILKSDFIKRGMNQIGVELNIVPDEKERYKLVPFEINIPEIFQRNKDKTQSKNIRKTVEKQKKYDDQKQTNNSIKELNFDNRVEQMELSKYTKAGGIGLLAKYLPELNPFSNLIIIKSLEAWKEIEARMPDRVMCRIDNLLGKQQVKLQNTSGKKEDIEKYINEIKTQDEDAVLLLLENKYPNIPRYESTGGFNIHFDIGNCIIMELVGKGFDGGDVTSGQAIHERYIMPWNEVLWIKDRHSLEKNSLVKYVIEKEKYSKTRETRMNTLLKLENDTNKIEEVPKAYMKIDSERIKDILDKIILPLYERSIELEADGLKRFAVQGNIHEENLIPFEICTSKRREIKKEDRKGEER